MFIQKQYSLGDLKPNDLVLFSREICSQMLIDESERAVDYNYNEKFVERPSSEKILSKEVICTTGHFCLIVNVSVYLLVTIQTNDLTSLSKMDHVISNYGDSASLSWKQSETFAEIEVQEKHADEYFERILCSSSDFLSAFDLMLPGAYFSVSDNARESQRLAFCVAGDRDLNVRLEKNREGNEDFVMVVFSQYVTNKIPSGAEIKLTTEPNAHHISNARIELKSTKVNPAQFINLLERFEKWVNKIMV